MESSTMSSSSPASLCPIVAVITGGGTGFGREMALALHKDLGATVILVGRRIEPLRQVQSELLQLQQRRQQQDYDGEQQQEHEHHFCHIVAGDVGLLDTWRAIADKVEQECAGILHFLGNNAASPDPGKPWDEMDDPQREIIDYNTVNISSVELGYHFLCPYLAKGALARKNRPSIVLNMSSCASVNPRAFAHDLPTYTPSKCAIDAITRCSYGLYKDRNILSYGINPVAYDTPILKLACSNLKLDSPSILAERYNPFPVLGDPGHVGEIAVALMNDPSWLESGCSYNLLPLTAELSSSSQSMSRDKTKDDDVVHGPQSILILTDSAAAYIHSTDMLAQLRGWAEYMKEVYDQKGMKLPAEQIQRIRAALQAKIEA